jgi:hypothetical protein
MKYGGEDAFSYLQNVLFETAVMQRLQEIRNRGKCAEEILDIAHCLRCSQLSIFSGNTNTLRIIL